MPRGVKLSIEGQRLAIDAYKQKYLTQMPLAGDAGVSRGTVGKFFDRKRVDPKKFDEICKALGLNPKKVRQEEQRALHSNKGKPLNLRFLDQYVLS